MKRWFDLYTERRWAGPDYEFRIRLVLFGATFTIWHWYD